MLPRLVTVAYLVYLALPMALLVPPSFAITLLTLMPLPPGSVRILVIRFTVVACVRSVTRLRNLLRRCAASADQAL